MGDLTDTLMPSTTPPLPTLALTAPNAATPQSSHPLPVRKDCWSEDAASTLIDAWGRRYMELNRGNLRSSNGTLTLSGIFFDRLDSLIGSNVTVKKPTSTPIPIQIQHPPSLSQSPPVGVPLYQHQQLPPISAHLSLNPDQTLIPKRKPKERDLDLRKSRKRERVSD